MQLSKDGIKLTEVSEGCRLKAYQDTGGVWTIGYGHTGGVLPNQTITKDIAETLLKHDLDYATNIVNAHALPCTQGQFDALVDFVFNVGPTQFLHSTLLKFHLSKAYEKAAAEFPKWKYDNGKVEPGLVKRREAEQLRYTHQGPVEVHQQTVEPEHYESSVAYSASANRGPSVDQSSQAPPVPPSDTAPGSDNGQSVFVSQALELFRKLTEKA